MRKTALLCCLLTGMTAAQTIPGMQAITAAQQQVVNRNALAFTGRSCKQYGASLNTPPPAMTAAQQKQALNFAFDYMLNTFKQAGISFTRVQRTADGGGLVYYAPDGTFMHVTSVNSGGRVQQGTFSCTLR